MRLAPLLLLAALALPPLALAGPPVPYCETRTVHTTFVEATDYNCIHISGYVCTDPRYFGGGGGGIGAIYTNWVCLDRAEFSLP